MKKPDFVIVGSSGGGATIAWTLAKQGFEIVILEQGGDIAAETHRYASDSTEVLPTGQASQDFNERVHDEYHFKNERPSVWKRPRGEYNTFRVSDEDKASPLPGMGGYTASVLGGGSVLWGTWSYRATPIDFRLGSLFEELKQLKVMEKDWGYSISDWPINYTEIEPYYNLAEALLGVSGDRDSITNAIQESEWYTELVKLKCFENAGCWDPGYKFPRAPIEMTPVGHFIAEGFKNMKSAGFGDHRPFALPSGLLAPGPGENGGNLPYSTRDELGEAIKNAWPASSDRPEFWRRDPKDLWSDAERDACNMCGFCGGFLCWGKHSPKAGSRCTTLEEIQDLPNVTITTNAKAIEVLYDHRLRRATGVRYLDISDPNQPTDRRVMADSVVLSCGAVQSARLLFMSGPPGGLGNRHDQLGRNATFHTFDLLGTFYLPVEYQGAQLHGLLHGEFGHTGNTASFGSYFVEDDGTGGHKGMWCKAGTMVSTAKHNPMGDAMRKVSGEKGGMGTKFLSEMSKHARKLQLRLTGDDLPMPRNRVDLDPTHVDEYGMPVARITRNYGEHEEWMGRLMKSRIAAVFDHHRHLVPDSGPHKYRAGDVKLIGDHQHSTCRMGDDPTQSVLDRNCRLHDVQNLFVVDTACFPTGFGLNPMVTVVANALRVGTWIGKEM